MAIGKKSFVLYCDLIHTITKMPSDKAGDLFKHILAYVNDENPITNDLIIELTFEPIKQQLKRDLDKWENEIKPKRSKSGRLGGLKSGEARRSKLKQNEANALNVKQNEANEAVNVSVNVNDINTFTFNDFWKMYPNKIAKDKCENKFDSLTNKEKESIKATLDKFISYKPFPEYNHPNPMTYLNQKRWNDVIPEAVQAPKEETEREFRLRMFNERNGL
jgi:hypothetical protein